MHNAFQPAGGSAGIQALGILAPSPLLTPNRVLELELELPLQVLLVHFLFAMTDSSVQR